MPDLSAIEMLEAARLFYEARDAGDEDAKLAAAHAYVEAERRHSQRLSGTWGAVIGAAVAVLLIVVLFVSLHNSETANNTADQANDTAHALVRQQGAVLELQRSLHRAAILTCERGNESRVVNIENLEDDIQTYREIGASERAIARKQGTIADTIAAQAPVAVEPGSPVVDCEAASLAAFHP